MKIISNYKPRILLCWDELNEKEKNEFDWIGEEEKQGYEFVKYKGSCYSFGDFIVNDSEQIPKYWNGYLDESYCNGILIKLCLDGEYVIMGRYYS